MSASLLERAKEAQAALPRSRRLGRVVDVREEMLLAIAYCDGTVSGLAVSKALGIPTQQVGNWANGAIRRAITAGIAKLVVLP